MPPRNLRWMQIHSPGAQGLVKRATLARVQNFVFIHLKVNAAGSGSVVLVIRANQESHEGSHVLPEMLQKLKGHSNMSAF